MLTSWQWRCLYQGLLPFFLHVFLRFQPILFVLLARDFGQDRLQACIPVTLVLATSWQVAGLCSLFLDRGWFYWKSFLILLSVLICCSGTAVVFLVTDLMHGFIVASIVYGVGLGLVEFFSLNEDYLEGSRLQINSAMGSILSGFVGGPLVFFMEDLLGLKGSMLLVTGIGLHALIVVLLDRGNHKEISRTSSATLNFKRTSYNKLDVKEGLETNQPLILPTEKAIEMTHISSEHLSNEENSDPNARPVPLPLAIDGKIPYSCQRRNNGSVDVGFRRRVNSLAEKQIHNISEQNGTQEVIGDKRRRLMTDPSNNDDSQCTIRTLVFNPERSVSVDVLQDSRMISTSVIEKILHPRSVSEETIVSATPEVRTSAHAAIAAIIRRPVFYLILLTFVTKIHLTIITTTMLDAFMGTAIEIESTFILAICLFLIFSLAQLASLFATDTLLRRYGISERSIILVANFVGGFTLLVSTFLSRMLAISLWAFILGLVDAALEHVKPNVFKESLGSRLSNYAIALAQLFFSVYVSVAFPLFVYYYRDQSPLYGLLYQIFGLLLLGVAFLWLFLEPFLDKPEVYERPEIQTESQEPVV